MSLQLQPEIETAIRERAKALGVSVNDLMVRTFAPRHLQNPETNSPQERVARLLAQWQAEDNTLLTPPIPTLPGETPTQALFRQWAEEDARMTEEEQQAADRLWEEIEQGLCKNGGRLQQVSAVLVPF